MVPIGNYAAQPFTATYDGKGYQVLNWQNDQASVSNNQGLIGATGGGAAAIVNVVMAGVIKVKGGSSCGAVLGNGSYNRVTALRNITINFAAGSLVSGSGNQIGSTVGFMYPGSISNIRVNGSVNVSGGSSVGGCVGELYYNPLYDIIVTFTGNITASGSNCGGILGYNQYSGTSAVACINNITGNITCSGSYVGGISGGVIYTSGGLQTCTNAMSGTITGATYVGGMAGSVGAYNDCINVMKGNVTSTSSSTNSGGIGWSSTLSYNRCAVATTGNVPYLLMNDASITSTSSIANNVYSNKFGMKVNALTKSYDSTLNTVIQSFNTFPYALTTAGPIVMWDNVNNVPYSIYTYTDAYSVVRTTRITTNGFAVNKPVVSANTTFNQYAGCTLSWAAVPTYTYYRIMINSEDTSDTIAVNSTTALTAVLTGLNCGSSYTASLYVSSDNVTFTDTGNRVVFLTSSCSTFNKNPTQQAVLSPTWTAVNTLTSYRVTAKSVTIAEFVAAGPTSAFTADTTGLLNNTYYVLTLQGSTDGTTWIRLAATQSHTTIPLILWTVDGSNNYQVKTVAHLVALAANGVGYASGTVFPANYATASFVQANDIDCSGTTMTPIGNVAQFTGTYNGQNFQVLNWQNNQAGTSDNQGMFGSIRFATIINIVMGGVIKVKGGSNCGALVGNSAYNGASALRNITINFGTGSLISGTGNQIGGTVGTLCTNSISNIRINGSVSISGGSSVGGFTGEIYYNPISDVIVAFTGNITASGSNCGGVVGYNQYSGTTAQACINNITGNITCSGSNVGGIAGGIVYTSGGLQTCTNAMTGTISGASYVGGIGGSAGAYNDCVNVMKGNVTSTSSSFNSGGIGWSSALTYNRCAVATSGNVPYLLMNDASITSQLNMSNNVYSNKFGMTVGSATPYVASMTFNGTTQFGLVNQPLTFGPAITLECWVLLANTAAWPRIIDFANGASGLDAVMTGFYTGLKQLWIQTTTAARLDLPTATVVLNTWTHVAFTVSATGNAICYLNGVAAQSGTVAVIPTKARTIPYWGKSSFAGESLFPGKMTELRFWTVERTASQILANYKTSLTGTETGLLLYISDFALKYKLSGNVITSQTTTAYTMTMAVTPVIDITAPFILSNVATKPYDSTLSTVVQSFSTFPYALSTSGPIVLWDNVNNVPYSIYNYTDANSVARSVRITTNGFVLNKPVVSAKTTSNQYAGCTLTWAAVPTYTYYRIMVNSEDTNDTIAVGSTTALTAVITGLNCGTSYVASLYVSSDNTTFTDTGNRIVFLTNDCSTFNKNPTQTTVLSPTWTAVNTLTSYRVTVKNLTTTEFVSAGPTSVLTSDTTGLVANTYYVLTLQGSVDGTTWVRLAAPQTHTTIPLILWTVDGNGKYQVKTVAHLVAMAANGAGYASGTVFPANYASASYVQANDINCSGTTMTPIGNVALFSGRYDGQGYQILNWQNDQTTAADNQGLFGYTNGVIVNLFMSGVIKVKGGSNIGAVIGQGKGNYSGSCESVTVNFGTGSLITGTGNNIGGIVGYGGFYGTYTNCRVQGTVNITGGSNVGGFIGSSTYTTPTDIITLFTGNIVASGSNCGGISGFTQYPDQASCVACLNAMTGNIQCTGSYVGGIQGGNGGNIVQTCTNNMTGNISGASYVGGIYGSSTQTTSTDLINTMAGSIISTSSSTNSGGIGYNSAFRYVRCVVATTGNVPYILMNEALFNPVTYVTTNNVYSNRFGMKVNNATYAVSNSYYTLVDLSSFPTAALTTNGSITGFESVTNTPFWNYTYTDALNVVHNQTGDPLYAAAVVLTLGPGIVGAGTISATTILGGNAPFTISWTGLTSSSAGAQSNLDPGNYTISVRDTSPTPVTKTYTYTVVTGPPGPIITPGTITNVTINGAATGAIGLATLTLTTAPYTYLWTSANLIANPTKLEAKSGLLAGTYVFKVTDGLNHVSIYSYVITQPAALSATSTVVTTSKPGASDGSISVIVSGGTSSYTYQYKNASSAVVSTSATANLLAKNTYYLKVTDSAGAVLSQTFNTTENQNLETTGGVITSVPVFGQSTGVISAVLVTGGSGGYSYVWSSSSGASTISSTTAGPQLNLLAGTYTLVITDSRNVTLTKTYVVSQNSQLVVTGGTIVQPNGAANGTISQLIVSGAVAPYTVVWTSTGTNVAAPTTLYSKSSLLPATYTAVVTDSAPVTHATNTLTFTLIETYVAMALTAGTVSHVSSYGASNGSITSASVTGGALPLSYSWTSSGAAPSNVSSFTTAGLTSIKGGTYVLTVADATARYVTQTYAVGQPILLNETHIDITATLSTGSITVTPVGGLGSYAFAWTKNGSVYAGTTATLTGLTQATYTCTVTTSLYFSTISVDIATYMTTTVSSTVVRAEWTAIAGAVNYRLYYSFPGTPASQKSLYTATTLATSGIINGLQPATSYLIEVSSTTDGVNYTRSFASTITTLAANSLVLDKVLLQNGTYYDITKLQDTDTSQQTTLTAKIVNANFATGDNALSYATVGNATQKLQATVVQLTYSIIVGKNSVIYLPFDAKNPVPQTLNLILQDGSTAVVTYNQADNTINVSGQKLGSGQKFNLSNQSAQVQTAS